MGAKLKLGRAMHEWDRDTQHGKPDKLKRNSFIQNII